ncbi:hypothetical protein [Glaciimonas soli]|uniref:Uncharacterized protein n=1 Tax=Glaciimonas soli TaxID=2590999 RepID=A0A843YVS9_9BURK|nr:hypothetical protein [Glaciimonas soli]MQR00706.1 hypothetical protein [Glaciimonas soli]
MTQTKQPIAYTSTLIPLDQTIRSAPYVPWVITPTPEHTAEPGKLGGMPWFRAGDTITFNIQGVESGSGKSTLTFAKLPPMESTLPTPFKQYNKEKHPHSPYHYKLGEVLEFDNIAGQEAQWSFTLAHDAGNGNHHVLELDPELRVGTGVQGCGDDKS